MRGLFSGSKKISKFPITLLFRANGGLDTEILYCSDKTSQNAVQRNRTKRILRALVRENKDKIPDQMDIAIISKRDIEDLDFTQRVELLASLLSKIPQ
ncbi:MAG: ribonuclease P protein component [Leptospiraceae bacterium]|nr:ribonuclease P protein component [Leptospiraceae bacterium]